MERPSSEKGLDVLEIARVGANATVASIATAINDHGLRSATGDPLRRVIDKDPDTTAARLRFAVEDADWVASSSGRWSALVSDDEFTTELLGHRAATVSGLWTDLKNPCASLGADLVSVLIDLGFDYASIKLDAAYVPVLRRVYQHFGLLGQIQVYVCKPGNRTIDPYLSRDPLFDRMHTTRTRENPTRDIDIRIVDSQQLADGEFDVSPLRVRRDLGFQFDRYHLDPLVPVELADRAFAAWVDKVLAGQWMDQAAVAGEHGSLHAFHAFQIDRQLQRLTGLDIGRRTLSLSASDFAGYGSRSFEILLDEQESPADYYEFQTFAQNLRILRYFNQFPELSLEQSTAVGRWASPRFVASAAGSDRSGA